MGFHLKFIKNPNFVTWDELSCLARCNGVSMSVSVCVCE